MDLHSAVEGDMSREMEDYSCQANESFCKKAMVALLNISPQFEKIVLMQGGTMEALLERIASFPEKTRCR